MIDVQRDSGADVPRAARSRGAAVGVKLLLQFALALHAPSDGASCANSRSTNWRKVYARCDDRPTRGMVALPSGSSGASVEKDAGTPMKLCKAAIRLSFTFSVLGSFGCGAVAPDEPTEHAQEALGSTSITNWNDLVTKLGTTGSYTLTANIDAA